MAEVINLITIEEGSTISTMSGATAEVVGNPKDGVWIFAKYLTSPEDPDLVGTEDMIFAQDIAEVLTGG
jgi:hypothetical protein